MQTNQTRRNPRNYRSLSFLLVGAGLLLFALVVALVLINQGAFGFTESPQRIQIVPAEVSFPAPNLRFNNLQGESTSLAAYLGQVVLINNWATWCPPCRQEMPSLEAYYQEHAHQGFTIVAISAGDREEDVAGFVDELGLSFEFWLDADMFAMRAFRNDSLPSTYIMDRKGSIRLAWTGAVDLESLEKYVTPFLEN